MAQTVITDALLNGLRSHLASMAAYGRYKIAGTWYQAELNSHEVMSNGSVHVTFYIESQGSLSNPATNFQVCMSNGTVLAEREESIAFVEYVDRILIRFKFGISVGQTEGA